MIPKILENHGIEPHLIIQREKKQFNQAKKGPSFKLIFYHDPTGDILNVMFLDDPLFVMFTGGFT
jgi:hypothetical protein